MIFIKTGYPSTCSDTEQCDYQMAEFQTQRLQCMVLLLSVWNHKWKSSQKHYALQDVELKLVLYMFHLRKHLDPQNSQHTSNSINIILFYCYKMCISIKQSTSFKTCSVYCKLHQLYMLNIPKPPCELCAYAKIQKQSQSLSQSV